MSYNSLAAMASWTGGTKPLIHTPLMDNAASTTVVDASGNARDGTAARNTSLTSITGPTPWLPTAMNFTPASSDAVLLPSAMWVTGSAARTYRFRVWVDNFDTSTTVYNIFGLSGSSNGNGLLVIPEDNAISVAYFGHRVITPKSTLSTGAWYSVTVRVPTGATSTSQVQIRIDGVTQTLSSETGSAQTLSTGANSAPYLGRRSDSATAYFDGRLSDFFGFDFALTDAEDDELEDGPEPVNTVAPALSGTETEGQTLSCTSGTWGLPFPFSGGSNGTITYSYQWTRSNDGSGSGEANISGATSSTYTLQAGDVGKYVRCWVRGTNDGGADVAADTASSFSGAIAGSGGGATNSGQLLLLGCGA